MKTKLEKVVATLCEELAKDKSEGSYYYSWQANIAVQFQDLFNYDDRYPNGSIRTKPVT